MTVVQLHRRLRISHLWFLARLGVAQLDGEKRMCESRCCYPLSHGLHQNSGIARHRTVLRMKRLGYFFVVMSEMGF